MKKKKHLKLRYLNLAILFSLLLFVVIAFLRVNLTKGDLNPPHINIYEENLTGIYNNVVRVDDKDQDYFYYKGLNYTHNSNGTLPSLEDKNYYPDADLVEVELTYHSKDINNNNKGYVSLSERQDTYLYNKVYPVETEGSNRYIIIELIENPFTDRPTDMAFNGWVSSYAGTLLSFDESYYLRTAKVPVTYTGGYPNKISIDFNASWVEATVSEVSSGNNWSNAFSPLNTAGMQLLTVVEMVDDYFDMTGYFEQVSLSRGDSLVGYYDDYGSYQTYGTCTTWWGGCTYYRMIENENFDRSRTYYELNYRMTVVNNNNLPIPQVETYMPGFTATSNMAAYFKEVTLARYSSYEGYYDSSGNLQSSGTCNSNNGCTYYEYLNYYDSNDNPSIFNPNERYFYLVTRDTNIIVMTSNLSNTWGSSQSKPFTLTSTYNGVVNNVTWTTTVAVVVYNDTNIENIRISSNASYNSSNPSTNIRTARHIYGSWNNLRIGRGILRSGSYSNFTSIIGGNNSATGSSGNLTNYRLIVESGFYSATSGAWTTGSSNAYIAAKMIYGNDYDRAAQNNDNLEIYFCASGSWGGYIRSSSNIGVALDTTVKSGRIGTRAGTDHTSGLYVGGRNGGTHYAARSAKIEGGWIYNVIGGPLTASSQANYNDSYIYMIGGTVELVIGGAGTTATYGNRILQITGGNITYSAFGGSNGWDGSSSDGTVRGDSYVYVGGNATIGEQALVENGSNRFNAESGSVFGNGNGRSGSSYTSIGSLSNSNIIIKDRAVIHQSVYGGGNYGATGISSGNSTTTTNIIIDGGTIKDSVYGGGNNNGSGNNSIKSTINIAMNSGEVQGSVYGGSNVSGTVFGDVNLDILGGNFLDSIYGGGRGGYTSSSDSGTYVRDQITINIGSSSTMPVVANNIYGGSAYGSVNTTGENSTLSNNGINLTVNNLEIGGSVFGGSKGSSTFNPRVNGNIEILINGGTIPNLFGGNDLSGYTYRDTNITLKGGNITNIYGGGNQVSGNNSTILLEGSAVTQNIYGGSNQSGNMTSSTINLKSGTANIVYGGNNIGGKTTTSNINVEGGNLTTIYGGGRLAATGSTNIDLISGTVTNVYGGGESASIDTTTTVNVAYANVTNLFGGSNQSGDVPETRIFLNEGNVTNTYGGNNAGGKTETSNVTVISGSHGTIYGGGKEADTGTTNVNISMVGTAGDLGNVFGGGESADVIESTNIKINSGTMTDVFGGSNVSGTVENSFITVEGTNTTINRIFGGNNMGGTTKNTDIVINQGQINRVFGGGNQASSTHSNLRINNNSNVIEYVYGGGNVASLDSTQIIIAGGNIQNVYGGSNQSGDVLESNIEVINNPTINTLYGGNNAGGKTHDVIINTSGGNFTNIYGGGNQATTGNTDLYIYNTTISEEVYGGGKDGALEGNANSRIRNSSIAQSLYSGGKGITAVVAGDTNLDIEGSSFIGEHVFGGGNAAATGTVEINNSQSLVNIAGATIDGNVYGGANTSVVYGAAEVNIGNISGLNNDLITIKGTVFGGGEANAGGSEIYDFSFISVTKGIEIKIRNTPTNNIDIEGSIFGSGNASSSTGESNILIENYGTSNSHKKNVSIQRATSVTLKNSHLELFGATDRTNEYSNVLFSISRVKELILSNNSSLYLETGTNLLEKFTSVVDNVSKVKGVVTINDGTVSKNVNNRLYSKEGVNINIATNEAVTSYGVVSGMSFYGMYVRDGDGNLSEAFYSSEYSHGDTVAPGEFYSFSSGSYVLGSHVVNHNIEVDGFYTNYQDEEIEDRIDQKYIDPVPEDSNFYMWVVGEAVASYDVDLIASRFSTLGSYELALINQVEPNTVFSLLGVSYAGLPSNFELVDQNDIPRISVDGTADTKMSLTMKSSRTGWLTLGETKLLTEHEPIGTLEYEKENSTVVPSFLFNLYHSKNIVESGNIGTVVLNFAVITPIDDLNNEVTRVNINVSLSKALYSSNEYEGAMTSGEEQTNFVSTQTDITDKSKLSAYYSLFIDDTDNIYKTGYHRSLVSSFVLPENTKITMIDFTSQTPEYYYYAVSAQDVDSANIEFAQHNEASYNLSRFVKMGSTTLTNNYDDALQNSLYYNSELRIASEEFIFIVDYGETNMTSNHLNSTLMIELRDVNEQTITSVLAINHGNLTYNIYNDTDALIELTASLSKNNIYIKEAVTLNLTTNFLQPVINGVTVFDTSYFDKKLGVKISIFDANNNQLNGADLLGLNFTYKGINYYPRMDGTTRLNLSPNIANASSNIIINTANANLSSGEYKITVESFGSPDGIYYGLISSDKKTVSLNILNNIYGLKTTLDDYSVTIDKTTGLSMGGSNKLIFNIEYASGLANPNLRIALRRRNYDEIYSLKYDPVDLSDYAEHTLQPVGAYGKHEYLIKASPASTELFSLILKENLTTGTYKVTFLLYDSESFIGEVYNYIVIR